METMADPELVELRPSTFEAFYRRHHHEIYRVLAVALRDHHLAAEATDEAMARAFQHWRSVAGGSNPPGWVYRVAYNYAIDRLRRRRRRTPAVDPVVWQPEASRPDLTAALSRLPVEQRAVVVMRCMYDWSEAQVAEALGIAAGTVKSRLARALEHLRREVSP